MITFGPVPSRRLGKSLGINNIVAPIYKEVEQHIQQLSKDNFPDYLTFVSNGEPTLDKKILVNPNSLWF